MTIFRYHPDILTTFPQTVGGMVVIEDVNNARDVPALQQAFLTEQAAVRARIGDTPLSELPSLAAWRAVFRRFGTDPTQYRSAPEALLRRLTKKEALPTINPLVDIGNLISIRYGVPVAVIDLQRVRGTITVRFAAGDETQRVLGQSGDAVPAPGEVIFTDAANALIARRWCWRQSVEHAAHSGTSAALVTIEAQHAAARADVQQAIDDISALLGEHVGGTLRHAMLDAAKSAM